MALKIKQNEVKGKRKTVRSAKDTKLERYNQIMDDFVLFCAEFVKIVDNHGELIPFVLNKEQSDFVNTMEKFNIILKSRR
ncbi:hypothetical protein FHR92_001052 [Fontibacillus solani]|uniref:Uncharacterized protein n=1 Tax=Fontibacillus solani TaxID=1572857 RepID=A0A7W3SQV8_9BACL|nr:hypothetical protein [Fontibacillus solani]MBA9084595.1 hypothetical protein [Fontibacillus solani]